MNQMPDQPSERPDRAARSYSPEAVKTQVLALDSNVAALLCYTPICLINLVTSIVFLKTEPQDNRFLRFHCLQSLFLIGAYFVFALACAIVGGILSFIPFIKIFAMLTWAASTIACVAFLYFSITQMISSYKGKMDKIPVIGDMAEEKLGG